MKEFKYLGYVLQEDNGNDKHIKDITTKGMIAMRSVWGIGERNFGNKWNMRWKLYEAVVRSILMYGVEVWGFKVYEAIEKLQERYTKWVFGLDSCTPGYMVREEFKRDKIRKKAGERAVKFETNIRFKTGNKLLMECWKISMDLNRRAVETPWTTTRREFLDKVNGKKWGELMDSRAENLGKLAEEEGIMRNKMAEREEEERWRKIFGSKYNGKYVETIVGKAPAYLEKNFKKGEVRTIARFRLGNEERCNNYWLEREKKKCRICYWGMETIEHLNGICAGMEEINACRSSLLEENGQGLEWMEKVLKIRKMWERK